MRIGAKGTTSTGPATMVGLLPRGGRGQRRAPPTFEKSLRPGEECGLTTRRWLGSNHAAGELPGVLGNVLEDDQKLL